MTVKQLIDLPFAPGIFTEQTERGAKGRWRSGDKVRFRKGLAEKIGGWEQLQPQFLGVARNILDWASLDGQLWSCIGTDWKLYLWQSNGNLYDITPIRRTTTITDPFTTVSGSDLVTVTDNGHGAIPNDFVTFTGASAVGGITISGEYQVVSVTDYQTYTIQHTSAATGNASGGGSVAAEYQINTGPSSSIIGAGWGTSTWNAETWGTPRTSSTFTIGARTWSLDNWGEDLIAAPAGGSLYWWDRTNGPNARAVKLEEAPDRTNFAIISQRDRHLFALGANDRFNNVFDPLLIRWCSQEDLEDWIPTSTNTSGDLRLYSGSKIICGEKTRGEILAFTDTTVHSIVYLGAPDVYGVNVVGENVSILGPNAGVPVDYRVLFMAEGDFYIYDGVLRVLPCDVRNYVYDRLDFSQKEKVIAGLNREFNEVWWFYPGPLTYTFLSGSSNISDWGTAHEAGVNAGVQISWLSDSNGVYSSTTGQSPPNDNEFGWLLENDTKMPTADQEVEGQILYEDAVVTGNTSYVAMHASGTEATGFTGYVYGFSGNGGVVFRSYQNGAVTYTVSGGNLPLVNEQTYGVSMRKTGTTLQCLLQYPGDATPTVIHTFDLTVVTQIPNLSGGGLALVSEHTETNDAFRVNNLIGGAYGEVINNPDLDGVPEITSYVSFNYEEGSWATGELVRTAWADRSPVLNKPYATGVDGYIYQHETGTDDNGAPMVASVESYDMEIGMGEDLVHVDQLVPDFLVLEGAVNLTFNGRKYPQATTLITKGPYAVVPDTRKVSTRMRARQVSIKVESDQLGDKWRMGTLRARAGVHGKRG